MQSVPQSVFYKGWGQHFLHALLVSCGVKRALLTLLLAWCIRLGPQGRHQCEIKHAKILLEKMLYEDKIKEGAMAV